MATPTSYHALLCVYAESAGIAKCGRWVAWVAAFVGQHEGDER
jgi:hypothetical protein